MRWSHINKMLKGFRQTVAIVSAGHTDFRSTSPDVSFKEFEKT